MSESSHRQLCYVLKTIPFKERDLIVVLFSETRGKLSAIARNSVQSRRFGGTLDLFTASEFEIDPKTIRLNEMNDETLVQILSAQAKHSMSGLSQSFEKLSGASCLNELLIKGLPAHKASPEIFKLYGNALIGLEETAPELAIAMVNAFILKFTQWLGVQPSLTRCLACEKSLNEVNGNEVFAQVSKGAWICGNCIPERGGLALSKAVILDAYHSMLNPIRKIQFVATPKEHEQLLHFLEQHLLYFVPGLDKVPLSSTRFLKNSN